MKKLAVLLSALLLAGCLATENRRVEITHRQADGTVAPVDTTTCWWRVPYKADRENHPMDQYIPQQQRDDVEEDLQFFSENTIRWPETLRPPYNPPPVWTTPAPKKTGGVSLEERLERPLVPSEGEVY